MIDAARSSARPRLRWNGLVWHVPGSRLDAWRYWRSTYRIDYRLREMEIERMFEADRDLALTPQ